MGVKSIMRRRYWRDITELAIERGKHPDDDMEELVNILIDQEWEGLPDNKKIKSTYEKFENIGKEEVAVIHSAFGDKPHVVAFVKVDKTLSDEDKCEQAFKLTNQ